MEDRALIEAAQRGDQLAFERLLRRYQRMLDAHASRFYLPGGQADDLVQEARIGFLKAVRFYRGGRGSSFWTFAELCVSRQLAGAIGAARRAKHRPLKEAARGDQAERTLAAVPDRDNPSTCLLLATANDSRPTVRPRRAIAGSGRTRMTGAQSQELDKRVLALLIDDSTQRPAALALLTKTSVGSMNARLNRLVRDGKLKKRKRGRGIRYQVP